MPSEPGSTAYTQTMNSTTEGHQARGQGLEQAASDQSAHAQTKCSAKAEGDRQKARARTESGCWPTSTT